MDRYALEQIPLSELSLDNAFCFRTTDIGDSLLFSVQTHGVLIPLIVTGDTPHNIVSGHRRRTAAEKAGLTHIPALVLKETLTARDLFLLALMSNHGQAYQPMEKVRVAALALNQYAFTSEEILKTVMPLIGSEPTRNHLEELVNAARLHPKLQKALAEDKLPFRGWQCLLRLSSEDQETFALAIASNLYLSASQLAQAGEWLRELAAGKKADLKLFLESSGLMQILTTETAGDRRQKTDAFMKKLRALRFPRLAGKEEQFEREARHIEKQLSGVKIEAPANFEDQGILLKFQVKDASRFEELLLRLQENKTSINSLLKTVL